MADSVVKLRIDSKEYDANIKRAGDALNRYFDTVKKGGGTLKYLDEGVLDAVRAMGSMETKSTTMRGKINELSSQFVEMTARLRQMSDEEKKGDVGKALTASLEQMKQRIKEAKGELNNINAELGSWQDTLGAVGSRLGINSELLGVVTTGTIGMTAAITAGAAAVTAAAKAWADYNSELAKQDQITTVTTGLSGADADQMTDAARSVAQVYDVDFREVINAANTLMTQFGESGDEAMRLIRDGMQGMIQGDGPKLLSMIQQYAPSFRDAGISASQLVAIIHNSEGGIFTDANMNAIVMGIKNIRLMTNSTSEALQKVGIDSEEMTRKLNDGSMTIFQAMGQVSRKIQEVGTGSQAAGEVMQAVFGRQGTAAGTNLGKAIETLNTNLEETKTQTGDVGEAIAELERANEGLNSKMRETFGMDGWDVMSTKLKTEVVSALISVVERVDLLKQAFGEWFDIVTFRGLREITGLQGALESMGITGQNAFSLLKSSIFATLDPLGTMLSLIKEIKNGFSDESLASQLTALKAYNVKKDQYNQTVSNIKASVGRLLGGGNSGGGGSTTPTTTTPKKNTGGGGRAGGGGRTGGRRTAVAPPPVEGSIDAQAKKVADLQKAWRAAADDDSRAKIKEQLDAANKLLDEMQGKVKEVAPEGSMAALNEELKKLQEEQQKVTDPAQWDAYGKKIDEVKDKMAALSGGVIKIEGDTDMGAAMIDNLTTSLVNSADNLDLSGFANKFTEAFTEGGSDIDLSTYIEYLHTALQGAIDEEEWPSIKLAIETGDLDKIEDFNKKIVKAGNNTEKGWEKAAGAVGQVGQALSSIDDPAAKAAGAVMEAIANIALGFATASAQPNTAGTGWGWLAWVAAGAAAMATVIGTIHSLTGFAEGGIVQGNTLSNDQIPAMLNAGEVVLSHAQQRNLANELEGGGLNNLQLSTEISGRNLRIVLNNDGKARGMGRLVTTNRM